jgi:hypothetical protein
MTGRAKAFFDDLTTQAAWLRRLVFILPAVGLLWFGALISGMSVEASPLMQTTPTLPKIVISEFRTNGAGGEFIEIFNAGDVDVNIGGWLIRGSNASATVGTRHTIPAGVILMPGQHYLIVLPPSTPTITPDADYSSGIVDDGGIAIVLPDTVTIVDAVGLSLGSAFRENTPLSEVSSFGDRSYERASGGTAVGCLDTNDNFGDFSLIPLANPQNRTSVPVYCMETATVTNTPTVTETPTITLTPTNTLAPTPVPAMSVIINEVAWGGTLYSSSDEWIELYNPGSQPVNLSGWRLISSDNSPDILLTGTIPAAGFYLLEVREAATSIAADQLYSGNLSNEGETLRLYSPSGNLVDTANLDGGSWNGGSGSPAYGSMERRLGYTDGLFSWITNTGVLRNGLDAGNNPINGTPKSANWANLVTPTRTVTPTATRTPTRASSPTITRTPTLIRDFVILNEVLPHALTDLNGDGKADVGDEYIELINLSNITVSLQGWLLDDYDPSTRSYALPAVLMSPGQKLAFFASQTGQYLNDGGDSVVLIRPGGKPADILTYPVVSPIGQAWCRVPDGVGTWYYGCLPTPNQSNLYQPNPLPTSTPFPEAGGPSSYFDACPLSDVDDGVHLAECVLPGLDIWNPSYWDAPDFNSLPMYLEDENSKPVTLE